ncbi:MAG TPA: hypothetical protein VGQ83_29995 [Polyangia bacterium]|jgi:hypothetical protein
MRAGALAPLALLVVVAATGCTPTLYGRLRSRDPYESGKLETYRSGTIVVGTGDVDVVGQDGKKPPLLQGAWFEIVGEDEIRFHVALSHKWKEVASIRSFQVKLTTDQGHALAPSDFWVHRATVQSHDITIGSLKPGPLTNSQPIVREETMRRDLHGETTVIIFRHRGIVSREVRSYTLSLDSSQRRMRFTWDLVPKSQLGDDE